MRIAWNIFGALLIAIGAVCCGRGAGYIIGSFMTNDRKRLRIGVRWGGVANPSKHPGGDSQRHIP